MCPELGPCPAMDLCHALARDWAYDHGRIKNLVLGHDRCLPPDHAPEADPVAIWKGSATIMVGGCLGLLGG